MKKNYKLNKVTSNGMKILSMNLKYIIFSLVLIVAGFGYVNNASAFTYYFNCSDGGTIYSNVDSAAFGSMPPNTTFQVQASMFSDCEWQKTVNLKVQHNGGAPVTLIPNTTISYNSSLPVGGVPVTQSFTTPPTDGPYSVTFTTGVYETFQCSDGTDNDSDGFTDYPSDSGCSSTSDNIEYNSGGGSGGIMSYYSCFIEDTKVAMADGTVKNIEDVKIGDVLKGETSNNTVLAYHRPPGLSGLLYGFNGGRIFFTEEHPFKTTDGWKSINPEKTKLENIGVEVTKLEVGDVLVTEEGKVEVESIESESAPSDTPLYNFVLSGDRTYFADGYLVHNKTMCTLGGTCIATGYDPHILTLEQAGPAPVNCSNIGQVYEGPDYPAHQFSNCGNGAYNYKGCYYPGYQACGTFPPQ